MILRKVVASTSAPISQRVSQLVSHRYTPAFSVLPFLLPRFASSWNTPSVPKDEEIPFEVVRLVNPDTNVLDPPRMLRTLLRTYNRDTHYMALVQHDPPIVKIFDKEEEKKKYRARKDKAKEVRINQPDDKEIQITWSVEPKDFAHKMDKAKRHLKKGNRVIVVLAPKQGRPVPDDMRRQELEQKVIDTLEGSGKPWKETERTRRLTALSFKPTGASGASNPASPASPSSPDAAT